MLTENFSLSEFESKDGSETPEDVKHNLQKLANNLQTLRNYLGKPIFINSGYRSPSHNQAVGGAKNSQHVLGKACDIRVKDMQPKEVYLAIEKLINKGEMLQGGLGLYRNFVHYDIRKTKVRF
jgi:uncharacterized protein YcbK (DUF882 family)